MYVKQSLLAAAAKRGAFFMNGASEARILRVVPYFDTVPSWTVSGLKPLPVSVVDRVSRSSLLIQTQSWKSRERKKGWVASTITRPFPPSFFHLILRLCYSVFFFILRRIPWLNKNRIGGTAMMQRPCWTVDLLRNFCHFCHIVARPTQKRIRIYAWALLFISLHALQGSPGNGDTSLCQRSDNMIAPCFDACCRMPFKQ